MLKALTLSLVAALLFSQAPAAKKDEQPEAYTDSDAYEIYSSIIPSEWPVRDAHAKSLVIRAETGGYQMCLKPEKEWEGVVGPAIADFVKKNEKRWLLQPSLSIELPYQLIPADELKSVMEHGSWPAFYQQHPNTGGWIELSAVGFNEDKTVAVVYMGHDCGLLCGGGDFHVLEKRDGKWSPLSWKGTSCSWRS